MMATKNVPTVDFADWLRVELARREWQQADLAKAAGISTAQVSRIISRESRPGPVFCRKVARAFGVQEAEVMQAAGLLAPAVGGQGPTGDNWLDRLARMFPFLSAEDKEDLVDLAEAKLARRRKGKK